MARISTVVTSSAAIASLGPQRERKVLAQALRTFSEERREQLYRDWGIRPTSKGRKQQLIKRLWDPKTTLEMGASRSRLAPWCQPDVTRSCLQERYHCYGCMVYTRIIVGSPGRHQHAFHPPLLTLPVSTDTLPALIDLCGSCSHTCLQRTWSAARSWWWPWWGRTPRSSSCSSSSATRRRVRAEGCGHTAFCHAAVSCEHPMHPFQACSHAL